MINPLVMAAGALSAAIGHELAHAACALRCGDHTAARAGRLTLNPFAHAELFGTIVLPALTWLLAGVPIGWLKPLPVNYRALTWRQAFAVSAAGPAGNLAMAALWGALCAIPALVGVGATGAWINLAMAAFNLLPIFPLDGGRMLQAWRAGSVKLSPRARVQGPPR